MNPIRLSFPRPHVACVEICREARGNSLTPAVLEALVETVEEVQERGARAAILRGAGGKSFSTGYDLEQMERPFDPQRLQLDPAARAIEQSPIPWIGFANGRVIGGGFELLLACDFRLAEAHATFRMPALRLSIPYPLDGLRRFVRVLGPSKTAYFFFQNKDWTAAEALAAGLVEGIGDFEMALELGESAANSGPLAVEYTKAALGAYRMGEDPANSPEISRLRHVCLDSKDLEEGLTAATEGRPPKFEGA